MASKLTRRLRRISTRFGFEQDWYLVFVAAVLGVIMSLVAIAFILPLRHLEDLGEHMVEHESILPFILVPVLPVVGALLAGWVIYKLSFAGRGPGVTLVMYAIYRNQSRLNPWFGLRKWLASSLTIGSGGSAGAEGPIVTIGAVIGSIMGRVLQTNPQNSATLLGCAAAAGIASVFNAPLAGIFFVLEILLRDFSLRTFTPIVIASVISAACTQALLHNTEPLFALGEQFLHDPFSIVEIPNYLLLGVLCGVAAVMFIKALYFTDSQFQRLNIHPALKPAIGATVLGLLGLGYLLWIRPGAVPAFYGNGYPIIEALTSFDLYYEEDLKTLRPAAGVLLTLVALGLFKGLATSLTIGSGGAGGMFAPSLLMGASVGGAFGFVVNSLEWFPSATPAHYAVVGMAAMVAATTHAPLTAILIVYETTRSYEIILPLMFTAVISRMIGRFFFRESIYTVKLTQMGVRVGAMSDLTLLRQLTVRDVPLAPSVVVQRDDSVQRLLDLSELHAVGDFVVVDGQNHYVGLVTADDLKSALVYREAIPLLQVSELVRSNLPTVTSDETLDVVVDKFSLHDAQSLAVLDERTDGAVLGLITRTRLMRVYQAALARE